VLDDELAALLPIFVDETRERLERLSSAIADLADDPAARALVQRELHTVKGASRMMQLGALAELCHAAEDALAAQGVKAKAVLARTADRLAALVERVASRQEAPERQSDLLAELQALAGESPAALSEAGSTAEPLAPAATPAEPLLAEASRRPEPPSGGAPANGDAEREGTQRGRAVADLRIGAAALDAIAERSTQVRLAALALGRVVDRLRELGTLAEDGVREPQPAQVLAVLATMLRRTAGDLEGGERQLARAAEDQLDTVLAVQLQPLRSHFHGLARHGRELAAQLGKQVEIVLEGEDTRLDRRVVRDLEEALLHLVRNAVDHGLDDVAARRAAGKPATGRLRLAARPARARVELRVEDDGRGIDPQAVRARAVAGGFLDAAAAEAMPEAQLQQLLFLAGFSTRTSVSEVSGRGIGLDVVAEAVGRLGGEVRVESTLGRGTAIVLSVPAARRGERVFVLRSGRMRLALPAAVVRSVATASPGDDGAAGPGERVNIRVGERLVPCLSLAAAFGQPVPAQPVVVEASVLNQTFAVAVESVEGEEEVLLRPLPVAVGGGRLLEGLAMLASGQPVAVLSPVALAQSETGPRAPTSLKTAPPPPRVRVLLVDDSRVTREMERRLLEDAGFLVAVAGDGEEALRALGEQRFDCVVTDIEMPNMDGFRLTRELRALSQFAHLPIVVVSTRDRPEDRLQGMQAGADAYLTKQSLNAGELIEHVRRLAGR
jgi:chemotaxis protein histidine kinase CheA/CheY-like chemotaxis protein